MNKFVKFGIYLIGAIMLIVIIVQYFKIQSVNKDYQIQSVELMMKNDSAKILKTKNGEIYSQLNSVVIESDNLKEALKTAGITNKELRQKDIKSRNLIAVMNAKIESQGNGSTAGHDTIIIKENVPVKGRKFDDWNNGNLFLFGLYSDNDSLYHKYRYQTEITLFPEKQGKKTKVTATLTDPHATITTGYSILVDNKLKWYQKWYVWGIAGLAGGYFITK